LPEFYANHLGINKWQAGLPVFYQEIPKGITSPVPEKSRKEIRSNLDRLLSRIS
jgi:hypothetical protein